MATLTLNIYRNKSEIEKTYTAESYDLMFGTVEDIIQLINVDELTDNETIARVVVKCFTQLKPFLKDIFEGVTDDELKRVKVKELIPLFVNVFKSILDDLEILKAGN